jgi:hypothetical protein
MSFNPPVLERGGHKHTRAIWICAIATSAFVAVGAVSALSTLAPVRTPANVAKAFLEAQFTHDSPTTWALMCETTRSEIGDYTEFARGVESLARYDDELDDASSDVAIRIDYLHGVSGPDAPSLTLAVTLTERSASGETWEDSGELLVVEEAGEFRVCDKGGYLW